MNASASSADGNVALLLPLFAFDMWKSIFLVQYILSLEQWPDVSPVRTTGVYTVQYLHRIC